jgi:hypothetical protein
MRRDERPRLPPPGRSFSARESVLFGSHDHNGFMTEERRVGPRLSLRAVEPRDRSRHDATERRRRLACDRKSDDGAGHQGPVRIFV